MIQPTNLNVQIHNTIIHCQLLSICIYIGLTLKCAVINDWNNNLIFCVK